MLNQAAQRDEILSKLERERTSREQRAREVARMSAATQGAYRGTEEAHKASPRSDSSGDGGRRTAEERDAIISRLLSEREQRRGSQSDTGSHDSEGGSREQEGRSQQQQESDRPREVPGGEQKPRVRAAAQPNKGQTRSKAPTRRAATPNGINSGAATDRRQGKAAATGPSRLPCTCNDSVPHGP